MSWPTLQFTKSQVNRAGDILARTEQATPEQQAEAISIAENWRACHSYPINTMRALLAKRLNKICKSFILAQRLKRMSSIIKKLQRQGTMNLTQMQDIGGLRAVLKSKRDVFKLYQLYMKGHSAHVLKSVHHYIDKPKDDGYRSVHLVYQYQNKSEPRYNGMLIEIQLRTQLQHAWATAVEVTSTIIGQELKANLGEEVWKDFFKLVSAAFSHIENLPVLHQYEQLSKLEVFQLVSNAEKALNVLAKLGGLSRALSSIKLGKKVGAYYLIVLDPSIRSVYIESFSESQRDEAILQYSRAEARAVLGQDVDAVLVSGIKLANLKKAYPNYFLDTELFVKHLRKIIASAK